MSDYDRNRARSAGVDSAAQPDGASLITLLLMESERILMQLHRMMLLQKRVAFYQALFERSANAVTALAAALHSFYLCRGWDVLTSTVSEY